MTKERYFAELTRILAQKGILTTLLEHGGLPVLLDGQSACHVQPNGGMVKYPGDLRTVKADDLYHRVAPIARTVIEYMLAVGQAPPLKAEEVDKRFNLLAKYRPWR